MDLEQLFSEIAPEAYHAWMLEQPAEVRDMSLADQLEIIRAEKEEEDD